MIKFNTFKYSIIELFVISFLVLLFVIISGCAGQYPPPGGPIDTIPPKIISSDPAENTLFFKGNKIILEFDKYMDQRSVQEAFFISPYIGSINFDWSGKKLKILFEEKLKENTTYVLVIGTSAKDRRGNNLPETFSIPFSTTGSIDSCLITGRVYTDKPEEIKIFAFKINNLLNDTTVFSELKPDYLSQTSKDGSFSLKYLAVGTYRLFAIRDVYNNLLYDAQADQYGTAQFDITFNDSLSFVQNLKFKLTQEDTSKPFITSVQPLNKNQITVELNEPVQSNASFKILNSMTQDVLLVKSFYLIKPNKFLLYTHDQDSANYEFFASEILDTASNEILPEKNIVKFYGSKLKDTTAPVFEFLNIKNNEDNIPLDKQFLLLFNEEILQSSFINGFELLDSNGNKKQCTFVWDTKVKVKILPVEDFGSKTTYFIKIKLDSLIDVFNNSLKDSTFELRFTTLDKNKISSISGKVTSDNLDLDYKKIIVEIYSLGRIKQKQNYTLTDKEGRFSFNNLPEGKYTIEAFIDKNSNLKYDCGKINPFEFSEYFTVYPDTINLRARWPIENVIIKF